MSQQRKPLVPIPTTIITGALNTGKTTVLRHLVSSRPPSDSSKWAVLVNEFGAVGIDAAAIEASSSPGSCPVTVKQLAGGCMCCALSGPFSAAIAQLIRHTKPERLLIEPSGLGHPGGLIDVLQGQHLQTALQLNAIICLVELSSFDADALMANEVFADQISVADVLVGSKADLASGGTLQAFEAWAAELYPPKAQVLTIANGQLDPALLDAPRPCVHRTLFSSKARQRPGSSTAAAADTGTPGTNGDACSVPEPRPRRPVRLTNGLLPNQQQPSGNMACGWVFSTEDVFDQQQLLLLLQLVQARAARIKGVFRLAKQKWAMPATSNDGTLTLQPLCYRRESRVEVIISSSKGKGVAAGDHALPVDGAVAAARQGDWLLLERLLLSTLL